MKIKLLVAAAATVVASSAMAQSAFQGFYGQLGTGYESNSFGNTNIATTGDESLTWNSGNQNANGVPLVFGLGYNFAVAPKWLLGLGVDYSALSQETSSYSSTLSGYPGEYLSGSKLQASNRVNIFVAPGYEIDKDKLVYLKAGYSMATIKQTFSNSFTSTSDPLDSFTFTQGSQSKTASGYVVGLGYKQMITSGFYGFAEANYMSYGKPSFSVTDPSDGSKQSSSPSLNTFQALVGVGYKF
jgi:opacity protein-like surface antigen